MKKYKPKIIFLFCILFTLTIFTSKAQASNPAPITLPFTYSCNTPGTLVEANISGNSTSPYWFLGSGAYMRIADGVCRTQFGSLSILDYWRTLYNSSNPVDTDNGYHPQNIFRLMTRTMWTDISQQASFYINKQNVSLSTERDAWSGILFFNRYQDQNNLYYAGMRDDGHVVIKKKKNGNYTTLKETAYFPGTYNRNTKPTLLPMGKWIGLKSEIKTNINNSVTISVYIDNNNTGSWVLAATVTDSNNPILSAGYIGIRGDFRDFAFDNYTMKAI